MPGQDEMPEFFRKFFGQPGGPGMPMPERPESGTSFGSGFVISSDGYVLTNHHVIDGASEVIVHLTDRRELKAKVVGSDPNSDIAVLKVDASNLPVLRLGDSRNLKPGPMGAGDRFAIRLRPFGHRRRGQRLGPSAAWTAAQRYVPFIQTDVAINRGNSGGPLLNTSGEVVGINSQIFSNSGGYMGVSFAIPIEVAMNAVRQIQKSGHVSRGQLGVQVGDVQRDQMAELGPDPRRRRVRRRRAERQCRRQGGHSRRRRDHRLQRQGNHQFLGAAAAGRRHAARQSRQRESCCATASRSTWSWC